MGYNAFVPCKCYREKKTPEPPYKEYIVIEDGFIDLEIPSHLCRQRDEDLITRMDREFYQWKESSCKHENMDYCNERVATGGGMAQFRSLVHELGGENRFPVLTEYLPTSNGGIVPSDRANDFLAELEHINSETTLLEISVLQNVRTDEIQAVRLWGTYEGYRAFQYNFEFQLGKHDVRLIEKQPKERPYDVSAPVSDFPEIMDGSDKILFRSSHYIQKRIAWNHYLLVDKEYGKCCSCFGMSDDGEDGSETEFKVVLEHTPINEFFEYCLVPLLSLARASVATGNPIHWC